MTKEARIKIILQRILEPIGSEINASPKHIREYGVNNVFQRGLSYLFGWTAEDIPVKIRATKTGMLKVSTYGAAYESYKVNPSSAAGYQTLNAGAVATEVFPVLVSKIDILGRDYDFYIQLSKDGVSFGDKILIEGSINTNFEIESSIKAVKLVNRIITGSEDGRYQLVGWW